jgi:hypothetical protein
MDEAEPLLVGRQLYRCRQLAPLSHLRQQPLQLGAVAREQHLRLRQADCLLQDGDDGAVGGVAFAAASAEHGQAVELRLHAQFLEEAALADAGLAHQPHDRAAGGIGERRQVEAGGGRRIVARHAGVFGAAQRHSGRALHDLRQVVQLAFTPHEPPREDVALARLLGFDRPGLAGELVERGDDGVGAADAISRLLGQQLADERVELLRDLRVALDRRDRLHLHVAAHHLELRAAVERQLAGDDLVQHDAEGIEVAAPIQRRAAQDLRRDVLHRTRHPAALFVAHAADEAEVDELDDAVFGVGVLGGGAASGRRSDEDVLRLHVVMDEAAGVDVLERAAHLHDEGVELLEREGGGKRGEVAAFDVLHGEERQVLRLDDTEVEHAREVGVAQFGERLELVAEVLQRLVAPLALHGLEREPRVVAVGVEVVLDEVDLAHAAPPEVADDPVAVVDDLPLFEERETSRHVSTERHPGGLSDTRERETPLNLGVAESLHLPAPTCATPCRRQLSPEP